MPLRWNSGLVSRPKTYWQVKVDVKSHPENSLNQLAFKFLIFAISVPFRFISSSLPLCFNCFIKIHVNNCVLIIRFSVSFKTITIMIFFYNCPALPSIDVIKQMLTEKQSGLKCSRIISVQVAAFYKFSDVILFV